MAKSGWVRDIALLPDERENLEAERAQADEETGKLERQKAIEGKALGAKIKEAKTKAANAAETLEKGRHDVLCTIRVEGGTAVLVDPQGRERSRRPATDEERQGALFDDQPPTIDQPPKGDEDLLDEGKRKRGKKS